MTIETSKVLTNTTRAALPGSLPLTCDEIAGQFSMIGNGPIVIDAKPGLTLHVLSGLVQICHPDPEGQQLVQGGQTFVLDRDGPVGLAAVMRAQVHIEWPLIRANRASALQQQHRELTYA